MDFILTGDMKKYNFYGMLVASALCLSSAQVLGVSGGGVIDYEGDAQIIWSKPGIKEQVTNQLREHNVPEHAINTVLGLDYSQKLHLIGYFTSLEVPNPVELNLERFREIYLTSQEVRMPEIVSRNEGDAIYNLERLHDLKRRFLTIMNLFDELNMNDSDVRRSIVNMQYNALINGDEGNLRTEISKGYIAYFLSLPNADGVRPIVFASPDDIEGVRADILREKGYQDEFIRYSKDKKHQTLIQLQKEYVTDIRDSGSPVLYAIDVRICETLEPKDYDSQSPQLLKKIMKMSMLNMRQDYQWSSLSPQDPSQYATEEAKKLLLTGYYQRLLQGFRQSYEGRLDELPAKRLKMSSGDE